MATIDELMEVVDSYYCGNPVEGWRNGPEAPPPAFSRMAYFNSGRLWLDPTRVIFVRASLLGALIGYDGGQIEVFDPLEEVILKLWG